MTEQQIEEKKPITIRFNVMDSDREMTAILNALNVSDRVDFIKECVMTHSRKILRNEVESLKMDSLKLKEQYEKNEVNLFGVTYSNSNNNEVKVLERIEEIIKNLNVVKINNTVIDDEIILNNQEDVHQSETNSDENSHIDNSKQQEELNFEEEFLNDNGVPPEDDFSEDIIFDDEGGMPPADGDEDED